MEPSKMICMLLIAVVAMVNSARAKTCPVEYARFSAQHTFCLDPNSTCSVIKSGVDKNDMDVILKVHNDYRSKIATGKESRAGGLPKASNMLQMEWDPELATIAQNWAAQCHFDHDCGDCRTVENFYVGQNLARQDTPSVDTDWKSMITMFYEEVELFNKKYINPFEFKSGFGHFSQLVWAETWRIGCGYVAFKNGNSVRSIYACNYGPGGNYGKKSMYKAGNTCSACPSNTCCGNCKVQGPTYPGLCKVENESLGPVYEDKKSNLLECDWKNENSPCKVNIDGKNDWKLKRSLSGYYTTIRLKGGEKSVMKIVSPIQPKDKNFCVVVSFRKGPINAAEEDSSSLSLLLRIPEWNWSTTMSLQMTTKDFIPYSINLGWNAKTEMTLELSVPPNSPEHIFDIKEIIAYDGKCS